MLDSFLCNILVSAALGFLSGLGIGGGSLLILWLTQIVGMDPLTARCINLMFFLPSALISCCFRWTQHTLNTKIILPAAIAGCISATVFSLISIETTFLKKLFGVLLIVTGLREVLFKPKPHPSVR